MMSFADSAALRAALAGVAAWLVLAAQPVHSAGADASLASLMAQAKAYEHAFQRTLTAVREAETLAAGLASLQTRHVPPDVVPLLAPASAARAARDDARAVAIEVRETAAALASVSEEARRHAAFTKSAASLAATLAAEAQVDGRRAKAKSVPAKKARGAAMAARANATLAAQAQAQADRTALDLAGVKAEAAASAAAAEAAAAAAEAALAELERIVGQDVLDRLAAAEADLEAARERTYAAAEAEAEALAALRAVDGEHPVVAAGTLLLAPPGKPGSDSR